MTRNYWQPSTTANSSSTACETAICRNCYTIRHRRNQPSGGGDPRPLAGNSACCEPMGSFRKFPGLTAIKSPKSGESFSSPYWLPPKLASSNSISCQKQHEKIVASSKETKI